MDVKCAFLNGYLQKDAYVGEPLGLENRDFTNHIFRLDKVSFGLEQAPRA